MKYNFTRRNISKIDQRQSHDSGEIFGKTKNYENCTTRTYKTRTPIDKQQRQAQFDGRKMQMARWRSHLFLIHP